jgi:Cu+-exporting ATPase
MTCAHCETTIRKYLEDKDLRDISVSFAHEEVSFDAAGKELKEIVAGIEKLGYKVSEPGKSSGRKLAAVERRFLFTVPFTLLLLSSMVISAGFLHDPYVQLGLCAPVLVIGIWHFGRSAVGSLVARAPNMDVLITLGAGAAFAYSLWGTLAGLGHDYQFYETSATIITLVLLGNVIEHRSVKQTTSAIRELGKLQPLRAKVVVGENTLRDMLVESLIPGDVVQVHTGDQVPADGKIISGHASLNESMISGENLPVDKSVGDEVVAGTLVENGSLQVSVSAAGEDSTLSRIIEMVKNARMTKAPMQKLADRISAVFVPVVVGFAMATFLISWLAADLDSTKSLLHAVAVLVIACPCAMGLATPTAVMVGLGRSAKRGILIRDADTTEKLRKVKTIVFDKTGTLTTGNILTGKVETFGVNEAALRSIVVGLEAHSSHPVGKAVLKHWAGTVPTEFTDIDEASGASISGMDPSGDKYQVGSFRILNESPPEGFDLFVTINGRMIGAIALGDEVKPEARPVIERLHRKGYRTILLSGDREAKCKAVADQVGITEYYAERLPAQKLDLISELTRRAPTAMVGDGINDAPALAMATVGISLSDATQVAIQSSQVILLRGNLERLPEALAIARHTTRTIRQNLFWAFFYNVIAIPVASVGLLSPMIAALSMAFSDVMVIGNSLLLRVKRIT